MNVPRTGKISRTRFLTLKFISLFDLLPHSLPPLTLIGIQPLHLSLLLKGHKFTNFINFREREQGKKKEKRMWQNSERKVRWKVGREGRRTRTRKL